MTSSILSHSDSVFRLDAKYNERYWEYLKSPEFHSAFLEPLGNRVARFGRGGGCLDVGCGEGQLSEHIPRRKLYTGIDASVKAIGRARARYPWRQFHVSRLEDYQFNQGQFDVVVFGGILEVLVKAGCRLQLLRRYLRFNPKYFIVYDLERFDSKEIEQQYKLIDEYHATAQVEGLQEEKKHRKILVYRVSDPEFTLPQEQPTLASGDGI